MKNFQEFQESTRLKRETGTLVKGGTDYKPKSKDKVLDACLLYTSPSPRDPL